MSLAWGALLLLLQACVGWLPARLLMPVERGLLRAAAAVALGGAITGLVQVALSAVGVPSLSISVVVLAVGSLLLARLGAWRPAVMQAAPPFPRALLAVIVAVALVSSAVAWGHPFKGDGGKFWGPRARELSRDAAVSAPALHDELRLAFHREYPLLVPALLAPAFAHSSQDAHAGPKLLLHGFTLSLLLLGAAQVARAGARGPLLALLLVSVPAFTSLDLRESAVAGGYMDAVAALYLLLVVGAVQRMRASEPGLGAAALLALSGAALVGTKLEGAVELLIILVAWALCGPRRRALLPACAALAVLVVPGAWLQWGVIADPSGTDLSLLSAWGSRLPKLLLGLGAALIDVSALGLLPLALLLSCLQQRGQRDSRQGLWPLSFGATLALGLLAFLTLVYLTTLMALDRHLYTSLHRLLLHWLPAFALLAASRRGEESAA